MHGPGPPTGSHSSSPSMSGQPPYRGYSIQSPHIPINDGGRNSPYVEFLEDDRETNPRSYDVDGRITDYPHSREMDRPQAFQWFKRVVLVD